MRQLRQSTSVIVPVGPMVDASDGTTLETSITYTSGEAYLTKHNAASSVDIGGNTVSAHLGGGMYNLTLTASDTDTVGLLTVVMADTAHRPVRHEFMVVPTNIYDSMIGGDYLQVDVIQINSNAASGFLTGTDKLRADMIMISGSSTAADNLEASALGITSGIVQSGSTTTSIKTNLTETQNDHFNDRQIVFTSGAQAGVAAAIADYDGATKALTISAIPAAPSNGDTFVIV